MVSDCVAAFDDPDGIMGLPHEKALAYEKYWYDAQISFQTRSAEIGRLVNNLGLHASASIEFSSNTLGRLERREI